MSNTNSVVKNKFSRYLTENPFSRYFTFSALYIAQGIPEGISYFAIPAWLAMNGKSPLEIAAFLGVVGIPWSFKILVAPLMDRYTILSMGKKRPWVIFGQLGLIISFLCIGFIPDPLNNQLGLMAAGFFISFFGAFQDVATDGMAVDVIPEKEQARANGLMWGTKTVGISLSLVAGTALLNAYGFTTAISSLSIAVIIIIIIPIFFRERPGEKLMPWTAGEVSADAQKSQLKNWGHIFKSLYKVVSLRSILIFCIGSLALGIMYGLVDTLLPIFTIQKLGWTNGAFSRVFSIAAMAGGFLGMFIGGYLVDYFGKIKMLIFYLALIVFALAFFGFMTQLWSNNIFVYSFIFAYYSLYTFLCIAVFASAMHLCWTTVAATQFTLYMAISNMGRAAGAATLGVLKTNFSWEIIFYIITIFPIIMAICLKFIDFKGHRTRVDSFVVLNKELVAPPVILD